MKIKFDEKTKKILIGAGCVLALALIGWGVQSSSQPEDRIAADNQQDKEEKKKENSSDSEKEQSEQDADKNASNKNSDDSDQNVSGQENSSTAAGKEKNQSSSGVSDSEPAIINLPYTIPGTSIQIKQMANYSGIFIEDGSDTEIENVGALLIENSGDQDVEYGEIVITQDGQARTFSFSALPAGKELMVQEKDKKGVSSSSISDISAQVSSPTTFQLSEDKVTFDDDGKNGIIITNVSDSELPTIRVFYKFASSEDNSLLGGITYNSKINSLKAGDSVTIHPSHYQSGHSQVVMIRTYEEVQ